MVFGAVKFFLNSVLTFRTRQLAPIRHTIERIASFVERSPGPRAVNDRFQLHYGSTISSESCGVMYHSIFPLTGS